jgi:hypothetical protein
MFVVKNIRIIKYWILEIMCSKGDNNGENIFLFLKSEEVKNDVRWGHQVI